jgi:Rrf2 family protein
MFSMTAKSNYALLAVMELVTNYRKGLVQIKEIVERRGIPKNYLEQIFNTLGKQGIVKSVRGTKGGFELGEDPAKLSLLKVLTALEGEVELRDIQTLQAVKELYAKIADEAERILDISLADLAARQTCFNSGVMYNI